MRGLPELLRPRVSAVCSEQLRSPAGKRQFARARFLSNGMVAPTGTGQGSHVMGGLAIADGLIEIPEDVTHVVPGQLVSVIDLRSG
jgi:molybdopterin molybdotransferase